MSSTIIVTRHSGAVDWLIRKGVSGEVFTDLTPEVRARLQSGDLVVGSLPVHLVADLNRRGVGYAAIVMDVGPSRRGRQLSADDMTSLGASLRRFRVVDDGEL